MKRAIVLAGGGIKGAYQAGFAKAIQEINLEYDIVTGTSIGALNGALLVQKETERLIDLWTTMDSTIVFANEVPIHYNVDELLKESNLVTSFFKKYIKEQGVDISPFKKCIHYYFNAEKFFSSTIDYGLVTVEYPSLKGKYIVKNDMKNDMGEKYLLATASCFPVFPKCDIDETVYIDGGYYDNLPIELALKLGAEEIIAVDLSDTPTHRQFVGKPNITYIYPSFSLGVFLSFDSKQIRRNMLLGYFDAMKAFKKCDGLRYTFSLVDVVPETFNRFYLQLLVYDYKLEKRLLISEDRVVSTQLCKDNYRLSLTSKEMNFAILDKVMILMDFDPYNLYQLDDVLNKITEEFKEAFEKDFSLMPDLNVKDVISTLENVSKKDLILKLIHYLLFPSDSKIPLKLIINVFAMEMAMALWILTISNKKCKWEDV